MRIIFVRHGHPNYEKDCLTELGHKHAAAVAERLKEEGIQQIFSSTCGRAYETAEYTAKQCGLPIEKCDFMREISWGSVDNEPLLMDGHPWSTADDMVANNESLICADWMEQEPFKRNKLVQYVQNVAAATDEWMKTLGYVREGNYYRVIGSSEDETALDRTTNKTIVAFGHGGASAAIISHLFNLPFPIVCSAMGPDYTGITIVTLSDDENSLAMPRFELLNDARHIQDLKTTNTYGK